MICKSLIPLFDAAPRDPEHSRLVDEISPYCGCENEKVTTYGDHEPVDDGEYLLRIVVLPIDAISKEKVTLIETSLLCLAFTGYSVLREKKAKPNEIRQLAEERAQAAARAIPPEVVAEIIGVVRFPALLARQKMIRPIDKSKPMHRSVCVYASPEPKRDAHAELLVSNVQNSSKNQRKKQAYGLGLDLDAYFVPSDKFLGADLTGISVVGQRV